MGFSVSKLFGKKNKNKTVSDTVNAIISDIENTPFGVSENNVLFAGLDELGGYYMFKTVIVGQCKIKTMNGAELLLKSDAFELKLKSDMPELESNASSVPQRSITNIDFQVEDSDLKILEDAKLTSIELKVKKETITFTKYLATDEEE